MPGIDRLSSVSSGVVNGGDYQTVGSWPGIRAAINARLEEVSFRTGVTAGAITLLVLAAATAAVVLTVMPSSGSAVNRAVAVSATLCPPVAATLSPPVAAAAVPVAVPSLHPSAHGLPEASSSPSATAAAVAPPAAQASQPSADPGPVAQYGSAAATHGARMPGQGAPGRHWPGQGTGEGPPRHGRVPVGFTGMFWRPFAPGRLGMTRPW
jgi:hypothetical protein